MRQTERKRERQIGSGNEKNDNFPKVRQKLGGRTMQDDRGLIVIRVGKQVPLVPEFFHLVLG